MVLEKRHGDGGDDAGAENEGGTEPVVLIALFKDDLQRAEADGDGEDAGPVALAEFL
jgi:hypothetical protein